MEAASPVGFDSSVHVYSTCPASTEEKARLYLRQVQDVGRWSERYGCEGILVYSDNRLVDPWFLARMIVEHTRRLAPLVAVQPAYMHPYAVAKMVTTFAYLSDRRLALNLVAGGFRNDLIALGDETPHDRRYNRLREYVTIIQALLDGNGPVSFSGDFYHVSNLRLTPPLRSELTPEIFISASSPAGREAARALGALAVRYPTPDDAEIAGERSDPPLREGVRVGVIARSHSEEAWRIAHTRFPPDRRGQLTHNLAAKVSDSSWYRDLAALAQQQGGNENLYWLAPFATYQTMCPYLVGSYEDVGTELARFLAQGCSTFILDIPREEEDLHHTSHAFRRALELVAA